MDDNEADGDTVDAKFTLSKLCIGGKQLWMADEEVENVDYDSDNDDCWLV